MLHFGVFRPKNPAAGHCWGFTETVTSVNGQTITGRAATSPAMPRNCPVSLGTPWGQGPQSKGGPTESSSPVCVTHTHTPSNSGTPTAELWQLMRHFISHRIDWKADLPMEEI